MVDPNVPVTLSGEIMQFMTGSTMDRIESFSRYLPFALLVALFLINFKKIKLSLKDMKDSTFYPILLCLEFSFWPLLFSVVTGELARYLCYLPAYIMIVYYLSLVRTDKYKNYFAALYTACSSMVLLNIVAFIAPGLPIIQTFYDLWPEIMSSISIMMTLLGLGVMYGSGGNGGSRVRAGNGKRNNNRANQINLARAVKG